MFQIRRATLSRDASAAVSSFSCLFLAAASELQLRQEVLKM